jgi:hypothetical protein
VRSSGQVGQCDAIGVDPQPVVQGGDDFLEMDRPVLGFGSLTISQTDHLSVSHSAAG